jgi:hypothetical protein
MGSRVHRPPTPVASLAGCAIRLNAWLLSSILARITKTFQIAWQTSDTIKTE